MFTSSSSLSESPCRIELHPKIFFNAGTSHDESIGQYMMNLEPPMAHQPVNTHWNSCFVGLDPRGYSPSQNDYILHQSLDGLDLRGLLIPTTHSVLESPRWQMRFGILTYQLQHPQLEIMISTTGWWLGMVKADHSHVPKEDHQVKRPGKISKQQTGSWIRRDWRRQLYGHLDDVPGTWFLPMIILVHGNQLSSLLNQNENNQHWRIYGQSMVDVWRKMQWTINGRCLKEDVMDNQW